MKIPTWLLSHQFAVLFVIFILLVGVYLIYQPRISRKADEGGRGNHPLRKTVIYFYIMIAMAIVSLIINYFRRAPSQVQLEKGLKMSTDNGLKYQAWQISHPYAVPLLIFIVLVVVCTICLTMFFRKTDERGQGKHLRNFFIFFCITTAMAIGALIISLFHGR